MATLQGNASVNGVLLSSSQVNIIDSPDVSVRCYSDYPSRMPVAINQIGLNIGSSMPNWATNPGLLQDLEYIMDVSIPDVPVGTFVELTWSLPSNNVPQPLIVGLDAAVIQANGITRFRIKFPAIDISTVPIGEIDYSLLMKFTTQFGSKDHFFKVWYNSLSRPAIGAFAPSIYHNVLPLYLPVNSFIDIGLVGSGGGGSGNNLGGPGDWAISGADGVNASLFADSYGGFMTSTGTFFSSLLLAVGYGGKGGQLNPNGTSQGHAGAGGAALVTSLIPAGQGLTGGDGIVSNIRLEREIIFRKDGENGLATRDNQVGGAGAFVPYPLMEEYIFPPGNGGWGGHADGANGWGGGGGSGGAIIIRLIYRNIPVTGSSLDLKARSKYVPPLKLLLNRNDEIRGGVGGLGNKWNGANGFNGRVAILDYGTF